MVQSHLKGRLIYERLHEILSAQIYQRKKAGAPSLGQQLMNLESSKLDHLDAQNLILDLEEMNKTPKQMQSKKGKGGDPGNFANNLPGNNIPVIIQNNSKM